MEYKFFIKKKKTLQKSWIHRQTDGRTDGRTDGQIDRQIEVFTCNLELRLIQDLVNTFSDVNYSHYHYTTPTLGEMHERVIFLGYM